jgi:iron complex transport system ATP-binding protein
MEPIIKAKELHFAYGDKQVLDGVSFGIVSREFLSVIGPNGSGKTTLLKLLSGYLTPQKGSIHLAETPINQIKKRDLAKRIGVVSQIPQFQFEITALQLVLMGRSPHMGLLAFEGKGDLEIAHEAMVLTDVADFKERSLFSLSGGEFQRVMIARALAQDPEILLLDEPTSYLDIKHQINICGLLKRMNRDRGLTIVSVFHDINLASHFSDRIVVMKAGKVLGVGTPEDVIRKELLESVYECPVYVDKSPVAGNPRVTLVGE